MSEIRSRTVGDLTVKIDRSLCVGFGDCVELAPEAFDLDDEEIVVFVDPDTTPRKKLLKACEMCPVDALVVLDGDGRQIIP